MTYNALILSLNIILNVSVNQRILYSTSSVDLPYALSALVQC